MKNAQRKVLLLPASLALATALFCACGSNAAANASSSMAAISTYNYDTAAAETSKNQSFSIEEELAVSQAAGGAPVAGGSTGLTLPKDERKIVLHADILLETKEFDNTLATLQKAAEDNGGFVSGASVEGSEGYRYARYVMKIPAEQYSAFMELASGSGTLISRNEQSDDITSSYVDVESRLNALKTQESRLLALMEESGSLEELLTVQNTLSEVQYEIDRYTATMRNLNYQVTYSTVNVTIEEVSEVTAVSLGFGTRLGSAFRHGWRSAGNFVQNLLLAIVGGLPALLFWALVITIAVILIRKKMRTEKAKRKTAGPEEPPPIKPEA